MDDLVVGLCFGGLVELAVGFGWGLVGDLGSDSLFVGWVDVGV